MSKSFRETFEKQAGRTSDKWDTYLTIYDHAFAHYQEREIALLEIGIQNGGSLEVHARYFAKHKIIIGCDINPRCSNLVFPDYDKIRIVVGDANADVTRNVIDSLAAEFDIIIDDGSHKSNDIILSFLNYFSRIKKGGLYIVEDLHASYWEGYDGGLFHPYSSMSFLKDLADIVNIENWGLPISPQEFLAAKHPNHATRIQTSSFSGIESVQFHNSVCLIKKNHTGGAATLGPRRIVGPIADVVPQIKEMNGVLPSAPDQSKNKWSVPR